MSEAPVGPAGEKKVDPKEARKAARLAEEAAKAAAAAKAKAEAAAQYSHIFGIPALVQSTTVGTKKFTLISAITPALSGQTVLIRARLQNTRAKGKMAFCVFRYGGSTIQGLLTVNDGLPQEMIAFAGSVSFESIVEVEAVVRTTEKPVTSTTQSDVELAVTKFFVISASAPVLPFQLEDAARREDTAREGEGVVGFDTRLNCRWLDLRTPSSNALFRIQSRVGQYFREFLVSKDFVEIHSPKMIGSASEGGASVFKLDYFGKPAFLAQSPQFYKQMALQGDMQRVFEIGAVFRAENANTHRHLTEFVGLDIEMEINEHYYEILDMAEDLFHFIFSRLLTHTKELTDICTQHPFEPFIFEMTPEKIAAHGVGVIEDGKEPTDPYGARVRSASHPVLRIPFAGAIRLLNTVLASPISETEDINTENEKRLGALVKERYGVDFFISDRFLYDARPFYMMLCADDVCFMNSYDMYMRGEEISSGAQRIHDPEMLAANIARKGVDTNTVKDYIDSFRLGAWPHGGFGVGLERVVMLYLGLKNIRYASMFPRDPRRTTP